MLLAVLTLGVRLFRDDPLEIALAFDFRFAESTEPIDMAVFGREFVALGGCGKAPMLIVFLTPFRGSPETLLFKEDPVLIVRTSGVEVACRLVGSADGRGVVGNSDLGGGREASIVFSLYDATGRLFRGGLIDLCGVGGKADVGGSAAGREMTGRVVAIEVDMVVVEAEFQAVLLRMCLPSIEAATAR